MKKMAMMVLGLTMLLSAGVAQAVNYYDGIGDVSGGANWSDGAVSVPPVLGLITNTVNAWTGNTWGNKGVRQIAGYLYDIADGGLYLNQGTIYEVDDPRTDYGSYTNLDVSGVFQIWHNTTAPALRLLSGHVELGSLHFITAPTIDITDGILHAGSFTAVNPKANFNFMADGTGSVVIDDMAGYTVGSLNVDFETGTSGDLTLGDNTGGATPTYSSITWLIGNGNVSVNGVADTDIGSYVVTQDGDATTIALNPYRDYDAFVGGNNDPVAPVGSVTDAINWENGVLPSGATTGVVMNTDNVWSGNIWQDLAVLQLDGYINFANSLNLRGGSSGSGITTVYTIDDSDADYASYTNFYVTGSLVMWSQYTEEIELNLLSGHGEVQTITLNAPGKGTINMGNGILHGQTMNTGKGRVNMLAGCSGAITVDSLDTSLNGGLYVNFEDGNTGSFTFGSKDVTNSAAGTWEWLINNTSQIEVNGVGSSDLTDFIISYDGLSTTIALNPYRDYPAFIGQNNDPAAPAGALTVDANWEGGVQPTGSSTGLVYVTPNVWLGTAMQDLAVLQVDGTMFAAGDGGFSIRGPSSVSNSCQYIIDDSDTDYASYTNLLVSGALTFWSQNELPMSLEILSGHVDAGSITAISGLVASNKPSQAVIKMKDGMMQVGTLAGGTGPDRGWFEVNLDMLAGGSGEMVFDALDCTLFDGYLNDNFAINFDRGNTGSITFGSKLTSGGTISALGIWQAMIDNEQVSIDGVVETNASMFTITQIGQGSILKLDDGSTQTPTEAYSSWIDGFDVADPSMTADSDSDGLSNLSEYALLGDPSDPASQGQSAEISVVDESGTNWFYYVHFERTDKSSVGLTYTPEQTSVLGAGWSVAGIDPVDSGAGPAGFNAVTSKVSMAADDQKFLHVKIELSE